MHLIKYPINAPFRHILDPQMTSTPYYEHTLLTHPSAYPQAACSGAEQFEQLASDYGLTSYYDKQVPRPSLPVNITQSNIHD